MIFFLKKCTLLCSCQFANCLPRSDKTPFHSDAQVLYALHSDIKSNSASGALCRDQNIGVNGRKKKSFLTTSFYVSIARKPPGQKEVRRLRDSRTIAQGTQCSSSHCPSSKSPKNVTDPNSKGPGCTCTYFIFCSQLLFSESDN